MTAARSTGGSTEMLELVGLAGFDRRAVTELSGGEAKRVALARSLAPAPRLVLLDEPLTGLDRDLHDHLAAEVGRILRVAGTTAILVTHDPQEAAAIADRVVRLDDLGGRQLRRRRPRRRQHPPAAPGRAARGSRRRVRGVRR